MSDKKYFGMFENITHVRREFGISDDLILPDSTGWTLLKGMNYE
jgi:hypothetical protein